MGEGIDWEDTMRAFRGAGDSNVLFLEHYGVTQVCFLCDDLLSYA